MRRTQFLIPTQREIPADVELKSHELCLRTGLVQPLLAGVFSYLPLGLRVLQTIEQIVREEMNAISAQELVMPILLPKELMDESGRWDEFGPVLFRLQNRRGQDVCLGPTHEEVITHIARSYLHSYKDLPACFYQIRTKLRDEPRPRGGLIRGTEFVMKDAYSFEADENSLDRTYTAMRGAYERIFERCGLETLVCEAASGAMGGKESNEFMAVSPVGENRILQCESCGHLQNQEMAVFDKKLKEPPAVGAAGDAPEKVHTPAAVTIEDIAAFFSRPTSAMLKSVFYRADDQIVCLVIRGDLAVNDLKVASLLKSGEVAFASEEELRAIGTEPGFLSPVGIAGTVRVIVDDSVDPAGSYVAGANEKDYHFDGVRPERDFPEHEIADIALPEEGASCAKCGGALTITRGIELGHIFKLGLRYSECMNARFLDKEGKQQPMIMGCYGIGVSRILPAILEQHHDENGIVWPESVAPFRVILISINQSKPEVIAAAESLYDRLVEAGVEVLWDDRDERPGVKFMDADLIGIPYRLVVSPRTIKENAIEFKPRREEKGRMVSEAELWNLLGVEAAGAHT